MIREASIYTLKKLPEDKRKEYGLRVLTTRRWLRGVSKNDVDIWLPEAGPSLELLFAWRHKQVVHWSDFVERYEAEQRACTYCKPVLYSPGKREQKSFSVSPVSYLAWLASTQVVTVLCWEQDDKCHRYELVKLIEEQMGVAHV